ncbi:hypothetical protein FOVG_01411 [Fusarium oxysporum f. sp. pisi HDV247]|uniref:Uncharacterized protein n=1 Tax=Fusarium oxysporum f. sp. pisi HDV247 TaxID=1080344 RepID=W9QH18_FUSOX|nr:hypothetical protein FOVG_01411 [Fusarium oxysporum f. sp. pisi HDV247]
MNPKSEGKQGSFGDTRPLRAHMLTALYLKMTSISPNSGHQMMAPRMKQSIWQVGRLRRTL